MSNLSEFKNDKKEYFFQLLTEEKIEECINLFSNPLNKCWEFIDDNGFTALHRSCIINNLRLTEIIIKKTRENTSSTDFMNYINNSVQRNYLTLNQHNSSNIFGSLQYCLLI